jgi:uncharacterized membrane protein
MELRPWLLYLHVASVVVWVGGMFFAYVCLRPVAAAQLQPAQRLPLWRGVFDLFLNWVWVAIAVILSSGLAMMLQVGFKSAPFNWHIMFLLGLSMMLIFALVYFVPYRMLGRACDAQDWPAGGAALGRIRKLVGLNLLLGLLNIGIATLGRGM